MGKFILIGIVLIVWVVFFWDYILFTRWLNSTLPGAEGLDQLRSREAIIRRRPLGSIYWNYLRRSK